MDEQRARNYFIQIHQIRQHLEQLDAHLEEIDQKLLELSGMAEAVKDAQTLTEGDELLVPLTNGVYIPTTAGRTGTLYLNVGAGTVITRSPEEAQRMLDEQHHELLTYREQLIAQRGLLDEQLARIEDAIRKEIGRV